MISNKKKITRINNQSISFEYIDYTKYLNCQACKDSGLHCPKHRIEVEKILEQAVDLD